MAARLAGLLRGRNENATLVPVRRSDAPVSAQPADQARPGGTGPGAADSSRAAELSRTILKDSEQDNEQWLMTS